MKNIILFGPPGIGKSTLIGILKTKGIGAIDLEDLYPNRIRFQVPNLVTGKILGAADLNPSRKYSNAIKVLLTAKQDVYDARRSERDQKVSGKASQSHHDVSSWEKAPYDYILDTSKRSALVTANDIIRIYKKEVH
jgi:hypothetical protein